ncbi:hypothetical protein BDA99DRAFT_539890 [Phascolomyces articulosus]|uniref:Uncharacterized protein n=1 Tax=Phascolomyces articulosus TaxID=60185 RepID=A0AAD5PBU3_9FUNG|nr:hypothetical protein BDA99DRAFT_539890 [Phascolomyces articulosus]
MRFTTSVIFAALAVLATVQALPANTADEQATENHVATKGESHSPTAKNKIAGFGDIELGDVAEDVTDDGVPVEGLADDGLGDVTGDITDELLDECLEEDFELEDCPDIGDFDLDECLLLPHDECLEDIRKFLKYHHEA